MHVRMKEVREQLVLPADVELSEAASADLVAGVASRLAPGLERSVGPVHWKVGDVAGVDWTAEGFVDGALVFICLRPSSRELSLLVRPGFVSPSGRTPNWVYLLLFGVLAASITVGAMKRSVGWALLTLIAPLATWISVDIVLQELRVRRAVANPRLSCLESPVRGCCRDGGEIRSPSARVVSASPRQSEVQRC